jgi:formate dehydrogenase major subunit
MDKLTLTINGTQIQTDAGKTILEVATENQIYIPILCHLKSLSPVGACRMCIVEVEGMRKVVTACTTPITKGMVIRTQTPQLKKLRRMNLELLFSERNHFCAFCTVSGGDCELQKLGYQHEMDHIRYPYMFPNLPVDNSHPDFLLDHNRCILCTRCIRYCDEIEGVHTLDLSRRGNKSFVTIDLHQSFENSSCTSCGGCVQVCPTGALFDKLSAFRGKRADCQVTKTICQQCSVGCGIEVFTKGNHIVRIDGDVESGFTHGHLCVKGRYETLLNHKERILKPMVLQNGSQIEFSWKTALDQIATRLKRIKTKSPDAIQAVISPQSTNESIYLFTKLFRETLGSAHADLLNRYEYDSLVRSMNLSKPDTNVLNLESDLSRLDEADCIFILGADPGRTHKVLASRIRSRVRKQNIPLITVNLRKAVLDEISNVAVRIKSKTDGILLNTLIHLALDNSRTKTNNEVSESVKEEFAKYTPETAELATGISWEKIVQISRILFRAENPVFVYGRGLTNQNNPNLFHTLMHLSRLVGKIENGKFPLLGLRHGANARGAFEMNMLIPEKNQETNETLSDLFEKIDPREIKFLFLALSDDEIQWTEPVLQKLSQIEFIVLQASYPSEIMKYAKVVLPSAVWHEKSGTMDNTQGHKQSLKPVFPSNDSIKEDWQIFAELHNRLSASPITISLAEIQREIYQKLSVFTGNIEPVEGDTFQFQCVPFLEEGK